MVTCMVVKIFFPSERRALSFIDNKRIVHDFSEAGCNDILA